MFVVIMQQWNNIIVIFYGQFVSFRQPGESEMEIQYLKDIKVFLVMYRC